MGGWHHRLNGHEFEKALGDGEGQGGQACCSPWTCKETQLSDYTELNEAEFNNSTWVWVDSAGW